MNPMAKNLARLGSRGLAVTTIVRQLRKAREDGDTLRLLDALVNALALLTAVLIIVREIREHRHADAALEEAPL